MDYLVIILWSYVPIALASVCFGILRGAGDTVTPMVISILMNVLNVLFSLVLIYGLKLNLGAARLEIPALGVRGAALGLTLARVVGMFLVLIPLIRGSKKVKLGLSMFRVRLDLLRCIFRIGIPASAEQLMFQGGRLITQIFIARLGTAALATNTIAGSIDNLSLIPGMALGTAATALIGQRIGARKPQEAKRQLVFLVWFASVTMALSSVLMVIVKQGFIHLYTQDAALSKDISLVLTVAFLVQPLVYATSFVLPGGLRGAGDIRYTMLVSIVSMWILRIFLGYIFSMILPWGVMGIWIAMFIDWLARSIFFIRRISRQEWLNRAII